MKKIIFLFFVVLFVHANSFGQQKIEPGAMNYLYNPRPNSIIYHDTLFKGSAQFKELFYRQQNDTLIKFYKKHQSNKIFGQSLSFIGTLGVIIGIRMLSSSSENKGAGWALIGGGFATTLVGGYFSLMGQQNLQMAVSLFNQRQRKAVLGMGVERNRAGLVYLF